jgi:hypothetical protein
MKWRSRYRPDLQPIIYRGIRFPHDPISRGPKWLTLLLVLAAVPTVAQSTITLSGTTYTLYNHPRTFFDGPGGVIDTGIKDASGSCSPCAPKAVSGNPAWEGLLTRTSSWYTTYPYTTATNQQDYYSGQQAAEFAMAWYSDNTKTQYLTAALYLLNNIDQFVSTICDETSNGCYQDSDSIGEAWTSYGPVFYMQEWMMAYELVQSRMTTDQRQTFADKWLNDIAAFGGIDGSPSTSCTNPTQVSAVNVTVSGGTVTANSPLFGPGQAIPAGYWIMSDTGPVYPAIIQSVTDSEHATIPTINGWNGYSGTLIYRRGNWTAGDCGLLWVAKHGRYAVAAISGSTNYPGWGGSLSGISNNTLAWYHGAQELFISLIDADVNASSRSGYEETTLYNDFYSEFTNAFSTWWTGFHLMGTTYGYERPWHTAWMNEELQISINGTPPRMGSIWDKDMLYYPIMEWLPSCAAAGPEWGQDGFYIYNFNAYHTVSAISLIMPIYWVYRSTNEGKWLNWTLQNRLSTCTTFGQTPGTNLTYTNSGMAGANTSDSEVQWVYAMTDPSFTATSPAPTAVLLNQVDSTASTLYKQSVLISRTGYSSITDTLLNFFGMGEISVDHNYAQNGYYPGSYSIFKGIFMLFPDGVVNGSPFTTLGNEYQNGGASSMYMEIGGAYNLIADSSPLNAKMPLGDPDTANSRFAYAMEDASNSYLSGVDVTRCQRHLVDFKKSGTQQFVIVYDDVVTSIGEQKQTYLHYPNNETASGDTSRGNTSVSGFQITSSYPGTGSGDATQLLTEVLEPRGANSIYVYTNHSNGTYTGGNGATFRVSVCASTTGSSCDTSNTEGEFVVVHMPVAGSRNSLPTMEMISTIDANHRGVEIDGSSPKVAVFPRAGTTYASATFTTAHSGTAQYLVAGLTPGSYIVTVGGIPIANCCTATSASDSIYFESTAGSVSVSSEF